MLHVMCVFLDNHFHFVAVDTCNTCMSSYLLKSLLSMLTVAIFVCGQMFQDCIKYLLHFPPPKFIGEEVSIYYVKIYHLTLLCYFISSYQQGGSRILTKVCGSKLSRHLFSLIQLPVNKPTCISCRNVSIFIVSFSGHKTTSSPCFMFKCFRAAKYGK